MSRTRAPRICGTPGCPNDTPCPTPGHTPKPWANAPQRRPNALTGTALTKRNARILRRDRGICYVCHQPGANQVDHVVPYAQGGTDAESNLAAIHDKPCHQAKTQAEARAGRQP